MDYLVKDISLAPSGHLKIDWADRHCPVLRKIRERFEREKPLEGLTVGMSLHLEMKSAVLALTLKAGGAEVAITGSNPLTTKDDVAAALAERGVHVYAWYGETLEEYYANINRVLDHKPQLIVDDGADMIVEVHTKRKELLGQIIGGCEETTSGVIRLKAMERDRVLGFPVIAVNDAYTKYLFDNRYGTGQSSLDGVLRATNMLIAGRTVVVCGYGWVGKGIALRARGMGAKVVVTEVDPIKALEAVMDGYSVMPMSEAARIGEIFITATGNKNVIREEHFRVMRDGAILCNAGHFDVEIDVKALRAMAESVRRVRDCIDEYRLSDGRRLYLLGEGRLVNLVCAEGHPAEIMDISFSDQALAVEYLKKNEGKLENRVYRFPVELDVEVARLKLEAMGVEIDTLTEEQREYLESWRHGT